MPIVTMIHLRSFRMRPMVQPSAACFSRVGSKAREGYVRLVRFRGFLPRTGPPVPGGAFTGEADSDRGKENREP